MNVTALRRIDRWFGVPLVAALTVVRKALDWVAAPSRPGKDGILFVKLAEQGSTVLAYPAIRRAVEHVGRDRVYFLVFAENRFIVDALDLIPEENVISIDAGSPAKAMASSLRAVFRVRNLPIGSAIDMEFFARSSAIFTYLSGAIRRAGLHPFAGGGPYRGDLMTHRLIYNPHLHTSQVFYSMVEALSEPPERFPAQGQTAPTLADMPIPRFEPAPADTAAVEKLIRELTGAADVPPLILLNVNCSDLLPLRRWPTEHYIELARRLLHRYDGLYVGFTGAPAEREEADRVAHEVGSPRSVSFAGRTTLRELLALYSLSRALVTNDSGPAHFATLTSIQVVCLFGPETPKLFASTSPRSHALWAGIVCSPCVNAYNNRVTACQNNLCMQRITVDEVFDQTCAVFDAGAESE
jgi:ADP-heptose:LPS heptosyltransferase